MTSCRYLSGFDVLYVFCCNVHRSVAICYSCHLDHPGVHPGNGLTDIARGPEQCSLILPALFQPVNGYSRASRASPCRLAAQGEANLLTLH